MTSPIHGKQAVADGIHTAISYVYANETARLAATGFTSEDLYKLAYELDTAIVWLLESIAPLTWSQITQGTDTNRVTIDCLKHTAGTITKGQLVRVISHDGSYPTVELTHAGDESSMPALGMSIDTITDVIAGRIAISDVVTGLNTDHLIEGDSVHVSNVVSGGFMNPAPIGPGVHQNIGVCARKHPTQGMIVLTMGPNEPLAFSWQYPLFDGNTALVGSSSYAARTDHVHKINNNLVATLTGARFSGPLVALDGFSGSLQRLSNGSSYLVAGSNITVTSGSTGQVTIAADLASIQHNTLASLQGGISTERYHLTSASWDLVTNNPTCEPNGFVDQISSTFTWNAATRTLYLAPKSPATSFTVYDLGRKYVITGTLTSSISSASPGISWFYISSGSLQNATENPDGFKQTITALAYVSGSGSLLGVADERHGIVMDWRTHEYLHRTIGTRYQNGLTCVRITTGTGVAEGDAQLYVTEGTIWDEDIQINITRSATPTDLFQQELGTIGVAGRFPILYRNGIGENWDIYAATDYPVYQTNTSQRIHYNLDTAGTWSTTQLVGNGDYTCIFIVATSLMTMPIVSIMGQIAGSLTSVQNFQFSDMNLGSLPFAEMKPIWKVIYRSSTAYANNINAYVVSLTDLRNVSPLPAGTFVSTAHSSLTGLTLSNSHPATAISVVTTEFTGSSALTSVEDDVQLALQKLSNVVGAASEFNNGLCGGTSTLNWRISPMQLMTLTASVILTQIAPIYPKNDLLLRLEQSGSGSNTVTWSGVKWQGSSPPTLSTASGSCDIVKFYWNGTNYYGSAFTNFA